jgi:hypothetical protein
MSLEQDAARAESLLHALALELRKVTIDGQTQALHVRALQLKHEVTQWRVVSPGADERRRVLGEICALHDEAIERDGLPSGSQLASARRGAGSS